MTDAHRPDPAPAVLEAKGPGFLPLLAALAPVALVTAFGLAAVWWHGAGS